MLTKKGDRTGREGPELGVNSFSASSTVQLEREGYLQCGPAFLAGMPQIRPTLSLKAL